MAPMTKVPIVYSHMAVAPSQKEMVVLETDCRSARRMTSSAAFDLPHGEARFGLDPSRRGDITQKTAQSVVRPSQGLPFRGPVLAYVDGRLGSERVIVLRIFEERPEVGADSPSELFAAEAFDEDVFAAFVQDLDTSVLRDASWVAPSEVRWPGSNPSVRVDNGKDRHELV